MYKIGHLFLCGPINTTLIFSTKLFFLSLLITLSQYLPPRIPDVAAFGDGSRYQWVKQYCVVRSDSRLKKHWRRPGNRSGASGPARGPPAGATPAHEGAPPPPGSPLPRAKWAAALSPRAGSAGRRSSRQVQPRLGPAHPKASPNPTLASPPAREHTWSSSLMSMKAGTLMVKARTRQTRHSPTKPTGKGSWHTRWRLTTASGSPRVCPEGRSHWDGRGPGASRTARSGSVWRWGGLALGPPPL